MADDDRSDFPLHRLEIVSLPPGDGTSAAWNLRSDDTRRYRLEAQTAWRWLLCDANGQSYPSPRQLELKAEVGPGRFWPSDAALTAQVERMRADGGDWLAELLPWAPYLIVGICRAEEDRKRAAQLALLFAGLVGEDAPELRTTLFHLRRLAWENLAALYESVGEQQRLRMTSALRRSLYAWQDEIVRRERGGFFALSQATEEYQAEGKRLIRVYGVEERAGIQSRREEAMKNVLLTGPDGQGRLRAVFRDSDWGREMATSLIQGWFLPRYDLDMAERLKAAVQSDGRLARWGWLARFSVRALIGGMILALLYWSVMWRLLPAAQRMGMEWLIWGSRPLLDALGDVLAHRVAVDWVEWSSRGVACGVYAVLIVQVAHWLRADAPDTSLPRLRAGMFLGVVGTLLQQNWNGLLHFSLIHPIALGFLCAGLAVVSWQVMRAKVAGAVGPETPSPGGRAQKDGRTPADGRTRRSAPTALGRCGDVFWQAGALAFLLSFLLVDFLSDSYLVCGNDTDFICEAAKAPGVVSGTYPSLVLLFTAILLFAGIFGQLLWEEKPLTEALA